MIFVLRRRVFMADHISVEIVYALPDQVFLRRVELPDGATVRDAVAQSGVCKAFPELTDAALRVGIYSKSVKLDRRVREGDRVELYRPLQLDPMEARRRRAARRTPD